MTYLERYEAGERDAVWTELRALGADALDVALLSDARRVAEATIRRVLSNLRRIDTGLRAAGYQFGDVDPQPIDAGTAMSATLRSAEETAQTLGLPPAMVAQLMASARQALGGAATAGAVAPQHRLRPRETALGDPAPHLGQLDDFERMAGPAPLAVGSFWRIVGWCDFAGRWPAYVAPAPSAPPLLVMPPAMLADDYESFVDDNGDGMGFTVELLADPREADGRAWPLIELPMARGADVRLPSGEWFVDYLRRTTRAAALPGIPAGTVPALDTVAAGWEPF